MSQGRDIALAIENGCYDLRLENGDLVADGGLETAIIISLFTDRRVTQEQLPEFQTSRKGWWGDLLPVVDGDQIGSRIWTLNRSKITNETLRLHEDYAREALQHLVEDGVADRIEIEANYNDAFHLILDIGIIRPENQNTRFNIIWDNQTVRLLNGSAFNAVQST